MATPQPLPFGAVLRRHRILAGLTQEALAERAGLSARAISDLERGLTRAPQPATLLLLAEALQLSAEDRAYFEAAARWEKLVDRPTPTPLTPPDALAEAQVASLETTQPPPASEIASAAEVVRAAPTEAVLPPPPRVRGKLLAGIVSVLLAVAILVGVLFSNGVSNVSALPHGRTLCLATNLPISGDDGGLGQLVENAVNLAVIQNKDLGSGYTLKVINYDDVSPQTGMHDPATGAGNVQQMVQNPCILGMVGPFNSGVAAAEMPIAANAGLVMISPANTNPALTLRPYASAYGWDFDQLHPPGKKFNYFRITGNDVAQGLVDADFTFGDLGARRVYVVNDPSPYGEQLASFFAQAFQLKGGTIAGTDRTLPGNAYVIGQVAARIAAAGPDAVFYGGTNDDGGALLKAQLVKAGYTGPFVGGDAVAGDPVLLQQVVEQAGTNAVNAMYGTQPFRDLSTFTSGAAGRFIRDYSARYPIQDLNPYSADAYDAAMVLITAFKNLIRAGHSVTRAAMIDQVQNIKYDGITGPIRFDSNGDIAHGVFSFYAVQDGKWAYLQQVSA